MPWPYVGSPLPQASASSSAAGATAATAVPTAPWREAMAGIAEAAPPPATPLAHRAIPPPPISGGAAAAAVAARRSTTVDDRADRAHRSIQLSKEDKEKQSKENNKARAKSECAPASKARPKSRAPRRDPALAATAEEATHEDPTKRKPIALLPPQEAAEVI